MGVFLTCSVSYVTEYVVVWIVTLKKPTSEAY